MLDVVPSIENMRRERRLRAVSLPPAAVPDPAFQLLLDLASASGTARGIMTSALGINAGIPQATMLRHLEALVSAGMCKRWQNDDNARRVWVALTDFGARTLTEHFRNV